MSTKTKRKSKNALQKKKEKSESNMTEVFVMPPNLLEKLGINLGNVFKSTQSQSDGEIKQNQLVKVAANIDFNKVNNKSNATDYKDNDSILETANLMKKSVLLSPTFIATDTNVISGELEIATSDYKELVITPLEPTYENSTISMIENTNRNEQAEMDPIQLNINNIQVEGNNELNDVMPETTIFSEDDNLKQVDKQSIPQEGPKLANLNFENTDILCHDKVKEDIVEVEGHVDVIPNTTIFSKNEILEQVDKQNIPHEGPYLSCKIGFNIEANDIQFHDNVKKNCISDNSNSSTTGPSTDHSEKNGCNNKVIIISEEIIDEAQLKTFLSPSKTRLTPIPMNTLIAKTLDFPSSDLVDARTETESLEYLISTNANKNNRTSDNYDMCNNKLLLPSNLEVENLFQIQNSNSCELFMVNEESNASCSNENVIDNDSVELDNVHCNNMTLDTQCKHLPLNNSLNSGKIEVCSSDSHDIQPSNNDLCNKIKIYYKYNGDKSEYITDEEDDNYKLKLNIDEEVQNNSTNFHKDHNAKDDFKSNSFHNNEIILGKCEENSKKVPLDKVSEIATYLNSFFKSSNKKSRNMKKSNIRESDSKLSIQGVEKPGGIKSTSKCYLSYKNIRTYQRKCKKNQLVPTIKSSYDTKIMQTLKINKDSEENITLELCPIIFKTRTFCKCGDFGQLSFYDCEDLYEHLHFSNQQKVDCDLDVIFSIYHEKDDYQSVDNITEPNFEVIDSREPLDFNFCWSEIPEEDVSIDMNMLEAYSNIETNVHVKESSSNVDYELSSEDDGDKGHNEEIIQKDSSAEHSEIVVIIDNTLEESCEMEKSETMEHQHQLDTVDKNRESQLCIDTSEKNTTEQIEIEENKTGFLKSVLCLGTNEKFSTEQNQIKEEEIIEVNKNKDEVLAQGVFPPVSRKKEKAQVDKEKPSLNTSPEISSRKRTKKQDNKNQKSKKKMVQCGVCQKMLNEVEWERHISSEHCYVAWLDGAIFDLETYIEDKSLFEKLNEKLTKEGSLICTFCKLKLKKTSRFILHMKKCFNGKSNASKTVISEKDMAKCGVCAQKVEFGLWLEHISEVHNYLAWKEEESPLDLSNDEIVWEHLNVISKDVGGLVCSKCGIVRKYVKQFLAHIKKCEGKLENSATSTALNDSQVEHGSISEKKLHVIPSCKHKMYTSKSRGNSNEKDSDTRLLNETTNISGIHTNIDVSKLGSNTGAEENVCKCAICRQEVVPVEWMDHIQKQHNYLAWKEGDPPLDLDDEDIVRTYLMKMVNKIGGLTCPKCGTTKKKAKVYLKHVNACEGSKEPTADDTVVCDTSIADEPYICALCSEAIERKNWEHHSLNEHYNLAWIKEKKSYDLTNKATVLSLLMKYQKQKGELKCNTCGITKTYVMAFFKHIVCCGKNQEEIEAFYGKCDTCSKKYLLINKEKHMKLHGTGISEFENVEQEEEEDMCQCALCSKKMHIKDWGDHVMSKHYNIAWMVGEEPLDLNNPCMADKHLKEYKRIHGKFVCNICRDSKASCLGFFAHVLVCGKTEEETEQFKALCSVCNKKYMRIYEYQHMRAHRDAEIARENKLINQNKTVVKQNKLTNIDDVDMYDSKRNRKAAEKAKSVIEKYNANNNACEKCGSPNMPCNCPKRKREASTDSDASAHFELSGDSESSHGIDMEVDEFVSEEEEERDNRKRKRLESCILKTQRIPFRTDDEQEYIERSYKDFNKRNLTDDKLFKEWNNFEYEVVPESELENYMPPLKESCQIKFGNNDCLTMARFEAKKKLAGMGVFTGGTAPCVRWAPARLDDRYGTSGQWLAVAAHLGNDKLRVNFDQLTKHPALVQIWNVGDFDKILPKLELGLAFDHGAIWAMDWCPSGARDQLTKGSDNEEITEPSRLGLLAVAYSDGKVYIYPIPYPSTILKSDSNIFIKLKPAVELRLTEGDDRKLYQATSLCWSTQKGHSLVVVGYSDGTAAFYDLSTNSPLLKSTDGKMVALYPYHDERFQNSGVTGLGVYPARDSSGDAGLRGAWAVTGVSTGGLHVGAPLRCASTNQAAVVSNGAIFTPHWPAVLFSGDEALVASVVNELELWGQGRRVGCVCAVASCARCACVAAFTPPFVRTMLTHPINQEINKKVSAEITLLPIGSNVNEKKSKDELTVKLEPNTYDEIITKYCLAIKSSAKRKSRERNPLVPPSRHIRADRYPLADVTSLSFCTTEAHHDRLAVATYSGVIFIIKV